MIDTRFWDDAYVARLSPTEKLAFLYLLTSPLTTIAGVYELPLRRAAFDVGLPEPELAACISRLEQDGKVVRRGDWVGIVNFVRHQSLNPSVRASVRAILRAAPPEVVSALRLPEDRLSPNCDRVETGSGRLSHLREEKEREGDRRQPGGRLGRGPVSVAEILRGSA
jgi:hypothetical protein